MISTHIQKSVDAIVNRKNPVITFEYTYEVHRELVKLGILIDGRLPDSGRQARYPRQSFEYRVDHGRGYFTQNTWYMWEVVPTIEDLPREKIAA